MIVGEGAINWSNLGASSVCVCVYCATKLQTEKNSKESSIGL